MSTTMVPIAVLYDLESRAKCDVRWDLYDYFGGDQKERALMTLQSARDTRRMECVEFRLVERRYYEKSRFQIDDPHELVVLFQEGR